ncbi:polycomb group protein fertilization-independent endosperm [Tanacetum coccineum]
MVKTRLGCEPVVSSLMPSRKRDYRVTSRIQEGKRPIRFVVFNFLDSRYHNVFATVGGNRALRCAKVQKAEAQSDWAKVHVSLSSRHMRRLGSLCDFALLKERFLMFLALLDYQCLEGGVIAVLQSYIDEDILSSFTAIELLAEFWTYVERSFTWEGLPSQFPTKYVQFPVLLASIHTNYVDCCRWLGDFMISKSVDNEFMLWEPKMKEHSPGEGTVDILQKYPVPECDIWFIKLSCDFHYNAAAIGNREGKIFVWELQTSPPTLIARLSHVQSKSPIRQTAMSFDGRYIRLTVVLVYNAYQLIVSINIILPIADQFDLHISAQFSVAVKMAPFGAGIQLQPPSLIQERRLCTLIVVLSGHIGGVVYVMNQLQKQAGL